jgi:2-dehydropantoate 2-reductase
MGVVEKVNEELFPDFETRPNYMFGIVSHGVYSQRPFSSVHAGVGTISLGLAPLSLQDATKLSETNRAKEVPPSSRYLLQTITSSSALAAVEVSSVEILLLQLEKLVVNAVINPLTVIFDCHNGQLFSNPAIADLMRLLLSEISAVIRSLPEIKRIPGVEPRFSQEKLEGAVVGVAEKTAKNISSMLQDMRAGRETEINYINGYVVKRGKEVGMECLANRKLLEMVEERKQISDFQISKYFDIKR